MSWKYYNKTNISNERLYEVLRSPIVTEKMTDLSSFNQFGFYVMKDANKHEIKQAVEKLFHVHVEKINVIRQFGKKKTFKQVKGRRSDYKKAIVHLKAGDYIDLESGVA